MAEDVSLKEYIDMRFKALEGQVRAVKEFEDQRFQNVLDRIDSVKEFDAQHFQLNELAIKKAETSMNERLNGMNEFRAQIKEERGSLATKENVLAVSDAFKDSLAKTTEVFDSRLKVLEKSGAFNSGKLWMIMTLFAAIPTIIALVAFIRAFSEK